MKSSNCFPYLFLSLLLSLLGANAYAYDIAVENAEGVTIYYKYINDGAELGVTNKDDDQTEIGIGVITPSYSGTVNIPETVTYMDKTIRVTSIGESAFSCCSITSVTIPNSVTSIGNFAFSGCTNLTSLSIPDGVTSIGDGSFSYCMGLTSLSIPNSVTSIGVDAFYLCTSLTSIIVDSDNTCYDSRDNCNALIETATNTLLTGCQKTTIPNTVTSIGDRAFLGCKGLGSLTIPNSVTSIGENAFVSCLELTSVTIPNSVTSIGDNAFYQCEVLTSVISQMENPCAINYSCFEYGAFENATLYVPQGTISKYNSTDYWYYFNNIVEGEPTGIEKASLSQMKIEADDGFINVSGIADGQQIAIYQTDGRQVATASAHNGTASVATGINKGSTAIVKIGNRAVKVVMQ